MANKKKKKLEYRYSGEKSHKFWDIVNSIKHEPDKQELYSLGVALQNMEEYVLKQLKNAKKGVVKEPYS